VRTEASGESRTGGPRAHRHRPPGARRSGAL